MCRFSRSIKAGGVGLNLVSANNVYSVVLFATPLPHTLSPVCEPWWNSAVEEQGPIFRILFCDTWPQPTIGATGSGSNSR